MEATGISSARGKRLNQHFSWKNYSLDHPTPPFRDLATEAHRHDPAHHCDQGVHDVLDPHDGGARRMDALDGLDQFVAFALGQAAQQFTHLAQADPPGFLDHVTLVRNADLTVVPGSLLHPGEGRDT
mgnify:CR=1 FL=1